MLFPLNLCLDCSIFSRQGNHKGVFASNDCTRWNIEAAIISFLPVLDSGSPGEVLPYKGLMGTCGQPGYVFRDFCLKQGIESIIFCLFVSVYQFLS